MSGEHRALLLDSVERMLADRCSPELVAAAEEQWQGSLWEVLEQAGLPLACVPEEAGGGGAELGDSFAIARLAAAHAAPCPLIETTLAGLALAAAGIPAPAGPLGLVWGGDLVAEEGPAGWALDGTVGRVPWGRDLAAVAALARPAAGGESLVLLLDGAGARVHGGRNLAFEPRDELGFHATPALAAAPAPPDLDGASLELRLALVRSLQIAGAAAAVRDLAVRFAAERIQFGRPIGRFQAVQQMLAELAAEAAAAEAAAQYAATRVEAASWEEAADPIAAAKLRASQAAGLVAELAHQVHGAIGFTDEHRLQLLTRRLWSWREEGGSESSWAQRLGRRALASDAPIWDFVTAVGR